MLLSIAADEKAALHFDDVASALDAGLPLAALGGDAKAGERAVHTALQKRGVRLTPTEDAVLLHGWRAGRAGQALRGRALDRRRRAEFARTVWAGLRYPFVLGVLILFASIATAAVIGTTMLWIVVVSYVVLALLGWTVLRGARSGAPWVARVPVAGRLLAELGELPYLETLHALYGSGVQLANAHQAAVGTVRTASVRDRLKIADRVVQSGRPLHEGLAESMALHSETRALLTTGEQSGQLEDALRRALERRRDVTARALAATARRGGQVAYGVAMLVCVLIIVQFYIGYAALWRR